MVVSSLRLSPSLASRLCRKQLVEYLSTPAQSGRYASSTTIVKPTRQDRARSIVRSTTLTEEREDNGTKPRSPNYGKLEPYDLSQRLIKLCNESKHDEAVLTLKSMPLAAQNVKVWNTLITNILEAQKYKLAYSLFTDLRRRGLKPSLRTYTTMLSGYLRIQDWTPLSQQLSNVHNIYNHLVEFLRANGYFDGGHEDRAREMRIAVTMYFDIILKADQFDRAIESFEELPLGARDSRMYAVYFRALSSAKTLSPEDAAARVRESWEELQQLREHHSARFEPSDILCYYAFCTLVASTDVAHHALAFDIARTQFGLRPGMYGKAPVDPYPQTLARVLQSAALLGQHDIIHAYADVVQRRRALHSTLRLPVLYTILTADPTTPLDARTAANLIDLLASMNPADIARATVVVKTALEACWRGRDFGAATRVLAAYQLADADDLLLASTPRSLKALKPQAITTRMWAHTIRAALAAEDSVQSARKCLQILEARGEGVLKGLSIREHGSSRKADSRLPSLVQALAEAALADEGEKLDDHTCTRWQKLRDDAQTTQRHSKRTVAQEDADLTLKSDDSSAESDKLELT